MSGNQNQLDAPVLSNNLRAFSEAVNSALKTTALAAALAANVVQVSPGGQTFSTISEAIASITDASQQKEYVVYAGPGTYKEQVTLKPWVYLQGAGPGVTIITAPPASGQGNRGTIVGSSNSSIGSLTATCSGGSWGEWDTALFCSNAVQFYAENVELIVNDDNSGGINMAAVAINDTAASGAPTQVYIAYSIITSTAQNGESSSWGL
ncbi:MAG TPA: pectinesterase family protein, partial [Blastocatellia bacterium]|nr:pectinesterase family protein [Blastocatellia bacterium]